MKSKDIAIKLLKFSVAFGLIGLMIHQELIDFSVLKKLASPPYLAIGLFFGLINLAIVNWRWAYLLRTREFDVNARKTMPLTLIGVFFNYAIPGAIGGDVVKAYYVARDNPGRKVDAVTSVIVDRILGLYGMVILALSAIILNYGFVFSHSTLSLVGFSTAAVFVVMTLFLGAAFSRRLRRLLHMDKGLGILPGGAMLLRLYDAFQVYRENTKAVYVSLLASILSQMVAIGFMMFVGYAVGDSNLRPDTFFFAVPLGFIVSALPIAPAGIGVGQYAFLMLFRLYSGTDTNLGQTAITAFQVVLFIWGLAGAYFYMQKKRPSLEEVMQ